MKTSHFNGLTEAEQERLVILSEECAEVIHAVSKILRHGYRSTNPKSENSVTNRQLLTRELGDLLNAIRMLEVVEDVSALEIAKRAELKSKVITAYLHHNRPVIREMNIP